VLGITRVVISAGFSIDLKCSCEKVIGYAYIIAIGKPFRKVIAWTDGGNRKWIKL
jgi:hypothetical protein